MTWVQKENKLLGKVLEIAKSKGEVYLGPTPLSHLVGHKGDEMRTLMCGLLESDVGEGPWTLLTVLLSDELFPKARHLIVELVAMSAASWISDSFAEETVVFFLLQVGSISCWLDHVKSANVAETLQPRLALGDGCLLLAQRVRLEQHTQRIAQALQERMGRLCAGR